MRTGFAQRPRLLVLAVLAFASTGCASLLGSYDIAANGLASNEDRLRRLLVSGQAPSAFQRVQSNAPGDDMLHALYHGVLAYHAGEYAESARALDIAAQIADERMTLSVSRAALSMVTSDLALHWEPGRTERLMIPYYGALARLKLGDAEGAAVEARRLSMLLQRYDDDDAPVDPALRAALRYVAGAVFQQTRDWADADVAYRNALAIDSTLLPYRGAAGTGTVLVVLEQGFVAHRAEQGLAVMLLPEEVHAIAHGGSGDKATASAFVAARVLDYAARSSSYAGSYDRFPTRGSSTLSVPAPDRSLLPESLRVATTCTASAPTTQPAVTMSTDTVRTTPVSTGNSRVTRSTTGRVTTTTTTTTTTTSTSTSSTTTSDGAECVTTDREVDALPYLLRVAWPAYRADYRPRPATLVVGGEALGFTRTGDVSAGVIADFESERALILARTIIRGTAKLALTKGAERKLEEKNEIAGRLVGLIGNVSSALLERADTRSWHLLPAGVSVARVELPPGEHQITVDIDGRRVSVGAVSVSAGSLNVVPARVW